MELRTGDEAPDFQLMDGDGKTVRLKDFRGKKLVLYFYPKDDTPGCTIQARDFTRDLKLFGEKGGAVAGVSPDSAESHCRFRDKYKIGHPLLVDENHAVAEKYGVWVEKSFLGKKSMGIKRSTFLIDGKGMMVKAMYGVQPLGHSGALLAML